MAPFATISSYPNNWRVQRAQVLAGINGLEIEEAANFTIGVTNKTPEFLAKFPAGKVPALETPSGFCLSESGAILLFVAESGPKAGQLLGTTPETRAKIAQWLFFVDTELATGSSVSNGMLMGRVPYNEPIYNIAIGALERAFAVIEKAVEGDKKFLVGNELTAADVSVVSFLASAVGIVLDAEMRSKVPATMAYFDGIIKIPEVAKVFTKVDKIETRKKPAAAA